MLNLTSDGNLVLFDNSSTIVWSTGTTNLVSPVVQIQDSGNLVLTDVNSNITWWQSFDYPGDTFLPGMKLGVNYQTNITTKLTSWKNSSDPSPGDYSYGMETRGVPQVFLWKGSSSIFRTGPWDGQRSTGNPDIPNNGKFLFKFVWTENEIYYTAQTLDKYTLSRGVRNTSGIFERWAWYSESKTWNRFWTTPADSCDNYAYCGANGICSRTYSSVMCQCIQGFIPKSQVYSDGCARRTALNCSMDGFLKIENLKLPDTLNASATRNVNDDPNQCRTSCLNNCSCTAYAMDGVNGCVTWFGNLMDIRTFPNVGDVLYVRLSASELGYKKESHAKKQAGFIVVISVAVGFLLLVFLGLITFWRTRKRNQGVYPRSQEPSTIGQDPSWFEITTEQSHKSPAEDTIRPVLLGSLPSFDLALIRAATEEFSVNNKLGEGGFGIVYKGKLRDGQEIAVKKLSTHSLQGPNEFRNELLLIANLQHRNLVRLLGCCIEGDERILILEYMKNGSLDTFIYDKPRRILLSWRKRLDIIMGIARGLLYLHQDSNMKVIHRDLKPSNILLDGNLNPKISDFGISKIFEGDDSGLHQQHTRRLVGTVGYMAPEYTADGAISLKSDVFSFGVIVLEILSGQRNRVVQRADTSSNLLELAYTLWKEGRSLEILDEALDGSYPVTEILRCIRVALLCVQEKPEDRPAMAEVALMLASEDPMLSNPKRPAAGEQVSGTGDMSAVKEITVTLAGR